MKIKNMLSLLLAAVMTATSIPVVTASSAPAEPIKASAVSGATTVTEADGNDYLYVTGIDYKQGGDGVLVNIDHIKNGALTYYVDASVRVANLAANTNVTFRLHHNNNTTYSSTGNGYTAVTDSWETVTIQNYIKANTTAKAGDPIQGLINVTDENANGICLDNIHVYYMNGGEKKTVALLDFEDGALSKNGVTVSARELFGSIACTTTAVVREEKSYYRIKDLTADGAGEITFDGTIEPGIYELSGDFRMPYFQYTGYAQGKTYGNGIHKATVTLKNSGAVVKQFDISPYWQTVTVSDITIMSNEDLFSLELVSSGITDNTEYKNGVDIGGLKLTKIDDIDQDVIAATEVDRKIAAIDAMVTLDSEDAIVAAREAYEALSDDAKALVVDYAKLDAALDKLAFLKLQQSPAPVSGATVFEAANAGNKFLYINGVDSVRGSEGILITFKHAVNGAKDYYVEANVRAANYVATAKKALLKLWASYTYNGASNGYTYPSLEWQTMTINNYITAKATAVKGNEIKAAINVHKDCPNDICIDDIRVYYLDGGVQKDVAFIDFEDGALSNDTITVEAWEYSVAAPMVRADIVAEQHYYRVEDLNAEGSGNVLLEAEDAGTYTLSGAFRMPYFQVGGNTATVTVKNNGAKVGEFTISPDWAEAEVPEIKIISDSDKLSLTIDSTITDTTDYKNSIDIYGLKLTKTGDLTADGIAATLADRKIVAIGTVTLNSAEAIADARAAYDALPPAAKELVTGYEILKAAESRLELLQMVTPVSGAVAVAANNRGNKYLSVNGVDTLGKGEGITIAFDHVTDGALTYFIEANMRASNVVDVRDPKNPDKAVMLRLFGGFTYSSTNNGYTFPTNEWQTMAINTSVSAKDTAVTGDEIKAAINTNSDFPNDFDIDDIRVYYINGEGKQVDVAFIDFEDGKLSNDTITVEPWEYVFAEPMVKADVVTEQHYHRVENLNAAGSGVVTLDENIDTSMYYTLTGTFRMPYLQTGGSTATVTVRNNGEYVGQFDISHIWSEAKVAGIKIDDPTSDKITLTIESGITDTNERALAYKNSIDIINLRFVPQVSEIVTEDELMNGVDIYYVGNTSSAKTEDLADDGTPNGYLHVYDRPVGNFNNYTGVGVKLDTPLEAGERYFIAFKARKSYQNTTGDICLTVAENNMSTTWPERNSKEMDSLTQADKYSAQYAMPDKTTTPQPYWNVTSGVFLKNEWQEFIFEYAPVEDVADPTFLFASTYYACNDGGASVAKVRLTGATGVYQLRQDAFDIDDLVIYKAGEEATPILADDFNAGVGEAYKPSWTTRPNIGHKITYNDGAAKVAHATDVFERVTNDYYAPEIRLAGFHEFPAGKYALTAWVRSGGVYNSDASFDNQETATLALFATHSTAPSVAGGEEGTDTELKRYEIGFEWTKISYIFTIDESITSLDEFRIFLDNDNQPGSFYYRDFSFELVEEETLPPPDPGVVMMFLYKKQIRKVTHPDEFIREEKVNEDEFIEKDYFEGALSEEGIAKWTAPMQTLEAGKFEGGTEYIAVRNIKNNYTPISFVTAERVPAGSYHFKLDLRTANIGETTQLEINIAGQARLIRIDNNWTSLEFLLKTEKTSEISISFRGGPLAFYTQDYDIANLSLSTLDSRKVEINAFDHTDFENPALATRGLSSSGKGMTYTYMTETIGEGETATTNSFLRIANRGRNYDQFYLNTGVKMEAGETYTITYDIRLAEPEGSDTMRSAVGVTERVTTKLRVDPNQNSDYSNAGYNAFTITPEWRTVTATFVAPESGTMVIGIGGGSSAENIKSYDIDNLIIMAKVAPTIRIGDNKWNAGDFEDADVAVASWKGETNSNLNWVGGKIEHRTDEDGNSYIHIGDREANYQNFTLNTGVKVSAGATYQITYRIRATEEATRLRSSAGAASAKNYKLKVVGEGSDDPASSSYHAFAVPTQWKTITTLYVAETDGVLGINFYGDTSPQYIQSLDFDDFEIYEVYAG